MADKENKRKCLKCGSSPAVDGVKLFRFTKPGTRNLLRCELWAKFMFPEGEHNSSIEFQRKLYNEHRVLCERHFSSEDFTDGTRKRLIRNAVPSDVKHDIASQPGPSQRDPLLNIDMNTEHRKNTESGISSTSMPSNIMTEKETLFYKKCTKYMHKICQLQNRIKKLKEKEVLNNLAEDKTVQKLSDKITPAFALLLQGQLRNCKRKLRGKRWSKEEKITALRIFKRSPTCYRLLRRLFSLPSPSTLKNLLSKIPIDVGCNESVFNVLKKFIKTQNPHDNQYILMFDEMSLKKHLQYNSKDDIIEGYQDHGKQGRSEQVAGYALVFMIGGIRKRVKQPIAHYFSSGFCTADRLAVLIKEVVHQCFEAGVNISATVCDMDGVNRRALSILGASSEHPYIKVRDKEIVTMYDTPHLLKCFRNLFMKYNIECDTDIKSGDKTGRGVAKWNHIEQFHQIDSTNPNFVFAPSLQKHHLNPNTKQKMKVSLAAQVLSHTVAAGMFAKISDGELPAEAAVTANVITKLDQLFDAVNSDSQDLRRGKLHATNISETSRHKEIFGHMKNFFRNMKFLGSSRKPPSQEGWIWTINAIERLWESVKQNPNTKSMATRRLQQDPLENLFGVIRGNCGCNTNPTTSQFVAALKTAILNNLTNIGTSGNCEKDSNIVIDNYNAMINNRKMKEKSTVAVEIPSIMTSDLFGFEIDESINENSSEIQACTYVCGFLLKKLPIKECETCPQVFLADNIDKCHMFVEFKEYDNFKKSLHYASKDMVACVEFCATVINNYISQKSYMPLLKKNAIEHVKTVANFDFVLCRIHKEQNINNIINSIFIICSKRFCILKNRLFAEEASAIKLKNKMSIIMHK